MQDWLYEDGEDTTKSVYVSKQEEIRFIVGPVIQRYQEKVEAEREAVRKAEEEAAAKKRAEVEAMKKAQEDLRKAEEEHKKKLAADKPKVATRKSSEMALEVINGVVVQHYN